MLYFVIIVFPIMIIMLAMPYYYQNMTVKRTTEQTKQTVSALQQNIKTYLDDLERLTLAPYFSDNVMWALKIKNGTTSEANLKPMDLILMNRALNETLHSLIRWTRKDILGTVLITNDGSLYVKSTFLAETVEPYPYKEAFWYQKAYQAMGKSVFIGSHQQDYLKSPAAESVFSVARMLINPDTDKPIGFIMADADTRVIREIINRKYFTEGSIVGIFDETNKPIYATSAIDAELERQIASGASAVVGSQDTYFPIYETIEGSNWKFVVLLSESEIKRQFRWITWMGIAFGLGGLAVTLFVFFGMSRWLIRPFKEMIGTMKRVELGQLESRLAVRGRDEVAQVGHALNRMIENVGEMIDREYKAQLNQRIAEYRSLQSQVQPHFLYNMLSCFIGLNRLGQKENLENAILGLSDMLRYILEDNDKTTIANELDFLEKYFLLQQLRFPDKLKFELICDPALAAFPIPKLLLQPLVENAIIHGVEPMDESCLVKVSVGYSGERPDRFEIRVEDDGAGYRPGGRSSGTGIGLANVKERLRMACPDAEFAIHSDKGRGTEVVLTVPWEGDRE